MQCNGLLMVVKALAVTRRELGHRNTKPASPFWQSGHNQQYRVPIHANRRTVAAFLIHVEPLPGAAVRSESHGRHQVALLVLRRLGGVLLGRGGLGDVGAVADLGQVAQSADLRHLRRAVAVVKVGQLHALLSGGVGGRAAAVVGGAVLGVDTVLVAQRLVDLAGRSALEGLHEALAEVVAEEGVEQRVEHAVGEGEHGEDVEEDDAAQVQPLALLHVEGDVHLETPVGQPARHVHRDHRQHQPRHPPVGLLLLAGLLVGPHLPQPQHHQHVEDGDERDGDGETQDQAVPDVGLLRRDGLPVGPDDDAGKLAREHAVLHRGGVQDDGQHHQEGHGPDTQAEEEGDARGAVLERADRVAHGQVAVGAHDGQGEHPGEEVDGEEDEVDLAHGEAEHPVLEDAGGGEEGQADDEEDVGDGQVEDVHVGDSLHLGVP